MTSRHAISLLALLALVACGGDGTGPDPSVPTGLVKVSGDDQVGRPGEALPEPLRVRVTDQDGDPMGGVTVLFQAGSGTLNPASPTTDAQGIASTVYTVGSQTGAVTVSASGSGLPTVEFSIDVVAVTCPAELSIAPGEAAAFDPGASGCDVVLRSGAAGDRYRIAVLRPTSVANANDTAWVTVAVRATAAAIAERAPAREQASAAPVGDEAIVRELLRDAVRRRGHLERMRLNEEIVERLGPAAWSRVAARGMERSAPAAAAPARRLFDVNTSDCTDGEDRVAHLLGENAHLAIYQDSIQRLTDTLVVSQAHVQRMLDYYALHGKPIIDAYFGGVPDTNGDGQVVMFITPIVAQEFAAFVWSGDYFDVEDCAASNEMELIYMSAPTVNRMSSGSYQVLGTVVHEMKHVSSLYNRLRASNRIGTSDFHPTWIEEGTAEIAGEMSSRLAWADSGGPAVTAKVARQDFVDWNSQRGSAFTPATYGVVLRLARVIFYLSSQPNGLVVDPVGADENHSVYGSGWHFHRWIGDAYSGAGTAPLGDADFFRAQNDSLTPGGVPGIEALLGKTFGQLLEEWAVAVSTNGTAAPQPARAFALYDFPSAAEIFCNPDPLGVYPWPITTTGTPGDCDGGQETQDPTAPFVTATYSDAIGPGGLQVYDLEASAGGQTIEIDVRMRAPGRIVVVRID